MIANGSRALYRSKAQIRFPMRSQIRFVEFSRHLIEIGSVCGYDQNHNLW